MNVSKVRKLHPKLKNIKDSYFTPESEYEHPATFFWFMSLLPVVGTMFWLATEPLSEEGKKTNGIFIVGKLIQILIFGYFILKECSQ